MRLSATVVLSTLLALLVTQSQTSCAVSTLKEGDTASLMFKTLQGIDSVMTSGAFGAISAAQGVYFSQTKASGVSNNKIMGTDSCFAMGTTAELLVVYAAIKLNDNPASAFATSLSDPIDVALSPSGLSIANPHNSKTVSYQDLMHHTSTLLDIKFDSVALTTPNTVGTLAAFIDSYFVTNGGALDSTIFTSTQEPGVATSFKHQRINIALLSYILERVITNKNLGFASLKHYIAQEVLQPFGMSSTFFLNVDGSAPGIVASPDFTGVFSAATVSATSAFAPYFQGCIVDQSSATIQIHAAYTADYMAYTTLNDLLLLANALVIDIRFSTVAKKMQSQITVTNTALVSQSGQGLGLQFYDGGSVCAPALQTLVTADCPLTNVSNVFGYTSTSRPTSSSGFLCADTGTAEHGIYCTASVVVYGSSSSRGVDPILALSAANFQEAIGTVTLTTPAPTSALRSEDDEEWFGVFVFIAVYGTLLVIIFGTSLLQYLFQPAALATNTNTAASTYALTNAPTGPRSPGNALSPR